MRADLYIKKIADFASNLEKHVVDAILESADVAKQELEEAFDKGMNIEGQSFEGLEWKSFDYKKRKTSYTSKRGRTFKHWYPSFKGTYKNLDLTGDFRESIVFEKNLLDVEVRSEVSYAKNIVSNLKAHGINVFSFKKSKKTKQTVLANLIKKLKQ